MSAPVLLQVFFGFSLFFLVFVPLERWLYVRPQTQLREGWRVDVIYYVLGCCVGRLSDAISLSAMLLIRRATGLNNWHLVASQPSWIQFMEIVIIADFFAYVFHRSLHRIPFFWRFHRVHHSSQQMDWLANVRIHPIDKFMGDCWQFIPIFFLGFSEKPLLIYAIFLGFQGFLNHSNIRINLGPLRWIVTSPQFHHWHHCDEPAAFDKNFASHLVIFDVLFGTAYLPRDQSMPQAYGVPDAVPKDFLAQMVHPFR